SHTAAPAKLTADSPPAPFRSSPAPPDLPFPHVNQVFLIERYVSDLHGGPVSAVAALGVASPGPDQATPAEFAGYVREHWSIESPHWIRDTLYQEDKSQIRTRSGPRIMAALPNRGLDLELGCAGPAGTSGRGGDPFQRDFDPARSVSAPRGTSTSFRLLGLG